MSNARSHLKDASQSALDLLKSIDSAMAFTRGGQHISFNELEHLYHAAKATFTRIAQAQACLPAEFDRRLPHAQTINLDAATQSVEKPGEFLLDILNDAKEM